MQNIHNLMRRAGERELAYPCLGKVDVVRIFLMLYPLSRPVRILDLWQVYGLIA